MPMIPELPTAMLACTRIGAPHTVVFGGFSAESLADRINDCGAKLVITADGGFRRGKVSPLKPNVDAALATTPTVEKVLVARRTDHGVEMVDGRDIWWEELVPRQEAACPPEEMESEDMLYLLYTSGTTAKPKGILHTTGGYLTGVASTFRSVFDHKDEDIFWCAADIGWVTGHSYIVYGPLANGATGVIYEGTPDYPDPSRWWEIVERYKVSILYAAPTAIRAHMKWGRQYARQHDLSSLRLLGTVGEPINPEAWIWYQRNIGGGRCPIVDTWWQTETGGMMISPLPGLTVTKPGSATKPLPGIEAAVVDNDGVEVPEGEGGYLVIKKPWPSMLRGIYGDPERYAQTYWSRFPGLYFPGDGARRDEEGDYWLMGRVDDVMNVSGHRLSTTEIESALVDDDRVAEAAVVGCPDPVTGEAIFAFVIAKSRVETNRELGEELRQHVAAKIGAIARPKTVMFTPDLPKTRSGKIMRRLLRDYRRRPRARGHDHPRRCGGGRDDPRRDAERQRRRVAGSSGAHARPRRNRAPKMRSVARGAVNIVRVEGRARSGARDKRPVGIRTFGHAHGLDAVLKGRSTGCFPARPPRLQARSCHERCGWCRWHAPHPPR
jgi:acetyl-CoA synthetase